MSAETPGARAGGSEGDVADVKGAPGGAGGKAQATAGVGMLALQEELMRQVRRLNDEQDPDSLEREMERTKALASLGSVVIDNANTMLRAAQVKDGFMNKASSLPRGLLS